MRCLGDTGMPCGTQTHYPSASLHCGLEQVLHQADHADVRNAEVAAAKPPRNMRPHHVGKNRKACKI